MRVVSVASSATLLLLSLAQKRLESEVSAGSRGDSTGGTSLPTIITGVVLRDSATFDEEIRKFPRKSHYYLYFCGS